MKWLKSARVIFTAAALVAVCLSSLSCSTGGISFPDPNLEEAIREAIDKPTGTILQSDLDEITYLDPASIEDLSGLQHCTNLRELHILMSELSDLSPIAGLTSLTRLTLNDCQITDISALSGLYQLEFLDLNYNRITDVSPLASLTGLKYLTIDNNDIADITPLSNLYNLENLDLHRNQITDIGPLVENTGLSGGDKLTLQYNPLSDTSINTYIPQLEARGVDVGY